MDRLELARKEAELLEAGAPYAAVTIVHSAGTARTEGKMLVLPDETIYGTVGGGTGEKLAIRDAVTLLAGGENAVRRYELDSPLSRHAAARLPYSSKAAVPPARSSLWWAAAMWDWRFFVRPGLPVFPPPCWIPAGRR